MNSEQLAAYFDHTILDPAATKKQVIQTCHEAKKYRFFSVCVNPFHIRLSKEELAQTKIKVCSVAGFPLGANRSRIKAMEAEQAIEEGADEIDMVMNIGALKSKDFYTVEKDIQAVVTAAKGKIVKVIIETCLLSKNQKVNACSIVKNTGAHFVKTSTGFGEKGATREDVALMKDIVGDTLQIKASGGIKTLADAMGMIDAGASRIGASAGVAIIDALLQE